MGAELNRTSSTTSSMYYDAQADSAPNSPPPSPRRSEARPKQKTTFFASAKNKVEGFFSAAAKKAAPVFGHSDPLGGFSKLSRDERRAKLSESADKLRGLECDYVREVAARLAKDPALTPEMRAVIKDLETVEDPSKYVGDPAKFVEVDAEFRRKSHLALQLANTMTGPDKIAMDKMSADIRGKADVYWSRFASLEASDPAYFHGVQTNNAAGDCVAHLCAIDPGLGREVLSSLETPKEAQDKQNERHNALLAACLMQAIHALSTRHGLSEKTRELALHGPNWMKLVAVETPYGADEIDAYEAIQVRLKAIQVEAKQIKKQQEREAATAREAQEAQAQAQEAQAQPKA